MIPEKLRQPRRVLEARAAAVVPVEEGAADPAPRPVAGRDQPRLPVEPLLPPVLPRVGREGPEPGSQVGGSDGRVERLREREAWVRPRQQPPDAERLDQQVGLVALTLRGEPRVARGGSQLRPTEPPRQLQAQQLVPSVVRLEVAVRGHVTAGVERPRVVDLPRPHPLVLQVVGEEGGQVRRRVPQQGEPRREGVLGVRVRLPAQVRRHRLGIGQVGLGLGDARGAQQVVVVDEPRIREAVDGAP